MNRRLWARPDFKPIERKRNTYAAVAATFAGGALIGGGLGAWAGGAFDGEEEAGVASPTWKPDPYVQKTQDFAFPYYTSMLEGKPNEYYGAIGAYGGQELQDVINMGSRDITNAVEANLASSGMARSGLAAESIGSKVGDFSTKLRWEDFNRAMTGRLNLLNVGSQGMSGVRSAALSNQGQMNEFNLGAAGIDLKKYGLTQEQDAADAAMWGDILGSGVSAAGSLYGTQMWTDAIKAGTSPSKVTGSLGNIDDILKTGLTASMMYA